jgi:glycosyltransferase involved in cell wall biosynthesis
MTSAAPQITTVFSAPFLGGSELMAVEYLHSVRDAGVMIDAVVPDAGALERALRPVVRSLHVVSVPDALQQISRFDPRLTAAHQVAGAVGLVGYLARLRHALGRTAGPVTCFGLRAQLAVGVLRPTLRRPLWWVVHEVVPPGAFAAAWGRAARRADVIYAESGSAASQPMLQHATVHRMPVRLSLGRFAELTAPEPPPGVVGLIGDLFSLKNHLALLEVVASLRAKGYPVDGVVVGRDQAGDKGEADRYAQSVRDEVSRADHVRLAAAAPDEMPRTMEEIDVLLHLSSVPESFGRVCVEAMAAGRPVVAYAHGAVAELVLDGVTGMHCPPGDTAAVTAAVSKLYDDPDLFRQLSTQARTHALERYGAAQRSATIGERLAELASR